MADVVPTGLHFLLPIPVLVWFLMVEQPVAAKSAFYAVVVNDRIPPSPQKGIRPRREPRTGAALAGRGRSCGPFPGPVGDDSRAGGNMSASPSPRCPRDHRGHRDAHPDRHRDAGLVELLPGGTSSSSQGLVGFSSFRTGSAAIGELPRGLFPDGLGRRRLGGQEGLIVRYSRRSFVSLQFRDHGRRDAPDGFPPASPAADRLGRRYRSKTGFVASLLFGCAPRAPLPFLFIYNPTLILYGGFRPRTARVLTACRSSWWRPSRCSFSRPPTRATFLARSRSWESAALFWWRFTLLFVPNFGSPVQPRSRNCGHRLETNWRMPDGAGCGLVVSGSELQAPEDQQTTLVLDSRDPSRSASRDRSLSLPRGGPLLMEEAVPAAFPKCCGLSFLRDSAVFEDPSVSGGGTRNGRGIFYLPADLCWASDPVQRRAKDSPGFLCSAHAQSILASTFPKRPPATGAGRGRLSPLVGRTACLHVRSESAAYSACRMFGGRSSGRASRRGARCAFGKALAEWVEDLCTQGPSAPPCSFTGDLRRDLRAAEVEVDVS